ncbi:DNA methylase-type I restriction-modification system [Methanohalobium evestigatum Z-7303]|uniref:DNA methylase-type I restriction-modification system n=1 Tax=Methanohalobium evestigatum (strain ATCC BAA-1072 / DSM 3721 / NBRC 107634 / OCM 161 / Z-7303) TaxID=644295 RepID=D7E671_METEZ|nr:restriction endonuclease subunit S [Methanohalobium evestigatum]ADI73093.1 DNA methylase-type I restriction-modification system [Methanohalobium evestigatum Z-7303]
MQKSIISFLNVKSSSKHFRFDAEYFHPEFLSTERLIKSNNYKELRDLIKVLTDYHANGSYKTLRKNVELKSEPDYAHMIRTVDIEKDDFENDIIYINKHAYEFLEKTKVYGGEIIINKIGNAGKAYLIPPIEKKQSLGMNQFMIRTNEKINNYYLYSYLAGKYGQNQLMQRVTGAVPLSIDKESTRSVLVPIFSHNFQKNVAKAINLYIEYSKYSKKVFKECKKNLLEELGLDKWKPKHKLTFVKNFSDTIKSERIDAEYYQPKYEEIVNAIKNYKGGWDILGNVVTLEKGLEVGRNEYLDEGIPFVRVSDISPFEIKEEKYISESLYSDIKHCQPQKDEILFTKDATPGIAHYLTEQPKKMIVSEGVLRLKNITIGSKNKHKEINNEYLTLVLNSIILKEQINRDVGGSVIIHWRPKQVKNVLIPILPEEKRLKIQQKIIKSLNSHKQAKKMLNCAKRSVEIAIEQDEKTADGWLKSQINN